MNAVILAAGIGTRLRPSTNIKPKPLIQVNGVPMIERQIEYLRQIGVNEIVVVTGYLKEEFNYLVEKYNVKLIFNDKFDVYNNCYSMYIARDYLHNTYVIEGDVYLTRNFLKRNLETSTYFSGIRYDFGSEWILNFNGNDELTEITVGSGTDYIMTGVSYWIEEDSKTIKKKLEELVDGNEFKDLFWDNIIKSNPEDFSIKINKILSTDWFEIDSINDLERVEEFSKTQIVEG